MKKRIAVGDTFDHGGTLGTVTGLGHVGWTRTVTVTYEDGFVNVLSEGFVLNLLAGYFARKES